MGRLFVLKELKNAPVPVAIVVMGYLGPQELSLFLGSMRLPVHRVALLLMFCVAAFAFLRGRVIKLHLFDYAFLGFNLWTMLAYIIHLGAGNGIEYGGSLALESFGSYFVARVFIVDEKTFRGALGFVFVAVAIAGAVALPEAVFASHFIHETLHKLTGYYHPIAYETRLGLTRAYSFFDHPIHLGTFCSSLFALIWYSERRRVSRFLKAGIVAGSTFLGLSSAPLLCLGVQGGLSAWDRVTKGIKWRAGITAGIIVCGYTVLSLAATRNPFHILATGLTLDPWTGYYRVMIWTHGIESVLKHPLLGIGLNDWVRPAWMYSSTIDAFWLVIAMTMGLPALVLLVVALVSLVRGVHKARPHILDLQTQPIRLAWTFALIALSLAGFTVHYWNAIYGYFFFICGMAGWMADDLLIKRASLRLRNKMSAGMPRQKRAAGREFDGTGEPGRGEINYPSPAPFPSPLPRPVYAFPRNSS